MNKAFFIFLFFIFSFSAEAQELYVPRNIKAAYTKGTRSLTGAPGPGYWQNRGVYDIKVKVNAVTKLVSGKETIVYSNNSPDTLKVLPVRFVNNIHKPVAPRSGQVSEDFYPPG